MRSSSQSEAVLLDPRVFAIFDRSTVKWCRRGIDQLTTCISPAARQRVTGDPMRKGAIKTVVVLLHPQSSSCSHSLPGNCQPALRARPIPQ